MSRLVSMFDLHLCLVHATVSHPYIFYNMLQSSLCPLSWRLVSVPLYFLVSYWSFKSGSELFVFSSGL